MYDECGSSSATMPLIDPSSRRLRSTGSTYSFSIQTRTRPSCSTTRYGLSRSLPACAKWLISTPKMTAKTSDPSRETLKKARDFADMPDHDTRQNPWLDSFCVRLPLRSPEAIFPIASISASLSRICSKVLAPTHFVIDSARLWVIVHFSLVSGDTPPHRGT